MGGPFLIWGDGRSVAGPLGHPPELKCFPGSVQLGSASHTSFQVCTGKMNLSDEVDLEDYVSRPDKVSAAEISAICQEAGMHAVRKNR